MMINDKEVRVATVGKMLIAGTAIAVCVGFAGQAARATPGGDLVAITGATIFDATGKDPYRGTVIVRDGRIDAVAIGFAGHLAANRQCLSREWCHDGE